jgi:hypothetical protein
MAPNRFICLTVSGLSICLMSALVGQLRADASKGAEPNANLVEAATAAYQGAQSDYKIMRATAEDVYQWSLRVMNAEKQPKSAAAHVERMRDLHERATARYKAGGVSAREYESTRFYLLEAQSLIAP